MKRKDFFNSHRKDVSLTLGGASIEHPLSIHSASIGRRRNIRGLKYVSMLLMALFFVIGNAWGDIKLSQQGSIPVNGGEYYLYSAVNGPFFFNTPADLYTSKTATKPCINAANAETAVLFKITGVTYLEGGDITIDKIFFISGNDTKYMNMPSSASEWGETADTRTWTLEKVNDNTNFADGESGTYPAYYLKESAYDTHLVTMSRTQYVNGTSTSNKIGELYKRKSIDTNTYKKAGVWVLITPDAYEDATGTAHYYEVSELEVYTDGSSSTDGGTISVTPKTNNKPLASATVAGDYSSSIAKRLRGKIGSGDALATIFCRVKVNDGYTFQGFKHGSTTLTNSETVAADTYHKDYEDTEYAYYRVSFAVSSTDTDNPTDYVLRACFEGQPVAYVYNANDEKVSENSSLAAAIAVVPAESTGYRVKLLSNLSATTTISKNLILDFNGYKIQGTASNMLTVSGGNVTFADYSSGTPGGVETTGATAVLVSGGSLTINDGIYQAATYAVERTGGSVMIKNGGYKTNALLNQPDISSAITIRGGFYTHKNGLDALETGYAAVKDIPTGMKYSASGCNYMVVSKTSSNYPLCVVVSEKENESPITKNFNTIEKALTYVNSEQDFERVLTLYLRENASLSAGNYTIPAHTTLVIPYSEERAITKEAIASDETPDPNDGAYCTLTLQNGAHIDVMGTIEVGGVMTGGGSAAQGELGIARPSGPQYGWIKMESGSSITLTEGANLNAYGYVTGSGTVDVRRGATVREMFQINDWKGYSATTAMVRDGAVDYTYKVLPVNQYFIQNVEVPATYRPGSRLLGQVAVKLEIMDAPVNFTDVGVIGVKYSDEEKAANPLLKDDVAVFLLDNEDTSEDTWVRKSYDATNDIQLYEVNNSAHLGSLLMTIDMTHIHSSLYIDADSREFVLPITNNFKIHLLYGNLYVTQDTELLPGAEIEINKKGTMTIMDKVWRKKNNVYQWVTEPQTLYLYDKDQWGTYVYKNKDGDDYNFGYATRVRYRPDSVPTVRTLTPEGLGDAKLTVHGTVDVKGYLKTTQGDWSAVPVRTIIGTNTKKYGTTCTATELEQKTVGGASITSTIADAGTIIFSRAPGNVGTTGVRNYIWQVNSVGDYINDEPDYYGDHVEPALLKNANGNFTQTKNTLAGKSFCYIDFNGVGTWKALQNDGCFVYEVVNDETIYYAKPKDYVALANGKTENADHTYTSATGDRTFILMDDCQWWEVEPVAERPDLFHCTHPLNDMYYYWDGSKWTEKRYTVTWKDWDGTTWDTYSLKYGVQPKFLGNVPQREMDAYYTYDFIGWSPAITDSTIVTGDVTYTAQYDRKDVMYTITWLDEGNNIIEVGYFKMGEVPTCTSADMTNKEWTPAVSAVTGEATYKLQPKDNVGPYDIKFVNWDGTQIGVTQSVVKNNNPTLPADPSQPAGPTNVYPTKPALDDIEFVFSGWTPTVVAATADAVYTATFQEKPVTYTITWKNSDGSVLETDENVTPNVVPQYNGATPVRPEDGDNYTFAGWGTPVVAATEDAEYVAKYIAKDKVVDGETYTVPASTHVPVTTITIKDDGKVSIPSGSLITATTLILESSGSMSGELIATNDRIHATNAYFDLAINAVNHTWYGFAVPWQVDAENGISVNGRTLELGKDFDIIYYDGARRASEGKQKCWSYIENDGDKTLQPGRLYMLALMGDAPVIRFAKKEGAVLLTTSTEVVAHPSDVATDENWNGVANPALFHAYVNAGNTVGQVYNPENKGYMPITMSDAKMVVGQGAFIQTPNTMTITVTYGGAYAAPRRNRTSEMLDLRIAPMDKEYTDRLFLQMDEDKEEDTYIIAQDLVKVGVSSQVAQMWVNRYNAQLCMNTIAPVDGKAEYPLGISVPANGEYTISLMPNEEYTIYLTRDGEAIWNLSDGAYTMTLNNGKYTNYGIRVGAKAPQVVTGVDEAVVDAKGETRKVLINNQVFIIRGNNVYSVDGQLIR